ncbi:MAG: hypothetical protein HN737_13600 [Desulfobacterales bacterium]|jgi:hypothetical protein|nr:hypothetical protein [Desulfobacteraceae bacterium]MBT4364214.1 hypothetical protein [Desulfobacteraceae bacterium]MBT7086132.1 hypothetical protein [Desulfobacterales bacterium]MBT7698431.1 hypothetical protein [Desulfobacterales bacterium]
MNGHHLILGTLVDFLTGETINDTHDERFRQKIARMLITDLGYDKEDINPGPDLLVKADNKKAVIKIDFVIKAHKKVCMIIRYGPGSLVTRYRAALAVSRVFTSYQIPVVVVTNGIKADIMNGSSGKITGAGLESIPDKEKLIQIEVENTFDQISEKQAEMESRIIYSFEVDGCCPCDNNIIKL